MKRQTFKEQPAEGRLEYPPQQDPRGISQSVLARNALGSARLETKELPRTTFRSSTYISDNYQFK